MFIYILQLYHLLLVESFITNYIIYLLFMIRNVDKMLPTHMNDI